MQWQNFAVEVYHTKVIRVSDLKKTFSLGLSLNPQEVNDKPAINFNGIRIKLLSHLDLPCIKYNYLFSLPLSPQNLLSSETYILGTVFVIVEH